MSLFLREVFAIIGGYRSSTFMITNVLVEWLTLLLTIREVPGSNLGRETGYPDFFLVLLSPSRLILGLYLIIFPRPLPSNSFLICHLFSYFYSTLYSLSY
jgi:hypothetical protein